MLDFIVAYVLAFVMSDLPWWYHYGWRPHHALAFIDAWMEERYDR